ncbi:unnamed protein product [Scytosiphon promiscuus]
MAHRVQLALYDLSRGMAKAMSMAILGKQIDGIWHTGLIVYGKEYFFGGGLQSMPHEQFVQMHGGVGPTEYIELGSTDIPQELFEDFNRDVQPRFTAQTYDLMKHNCNTYTNEASQFLVGKGIPEYIVGLPEEVLNSPMGGMLRPLLEQMTTQMNGADPYSALHHGAGAGASAPAAPPAAAPPTPTGAAAAAAEQRAAIAGGGGGTGSVGGADSQQCATATFPILDKHTKPLVGSDTAKAAPGVVARLKALGASVEGLLSEEESAVLDSLPSSMASPKANPVTPGSFRLMQKIVTPGSGWPKKAEFLALLLVSLMVLHKAEGTEMEDSMKEVCRRTHATGDDQLSAQSLSIAICAAANSFGTPGGREFITRADVLPGWLDAALSGLQHERSEVRQMCSALLNNLSLALAEAISTKASSAAGGSTEMSDEVTQILFGVLDGLQDETSQLVALRRALSAARLVRASGPEAAQLIQDVGLVQQVETFLSKTKEGEAKGAAGELLRILR